MSHDWQFSTVQEFLRQCNWQGIAEGIEAPKTPSSKTFKAPLQHQNQSWQCLTVQEFLGQSNWNGQLQPVHVPTVTRTTHPTVASPLPATLTVRKFFNRFVWEAQPDIAAVPKLNALDSPVDSSDLNLSDFSDLF